MPGLPRITVEQVQGLLPQCSNVASVGSGGQKVVFKGTIAGVVYALKFATAPDLGDDVGDFSASDVAVRAKREVETMRDCPSPHMVKIGPVGLDFAQIGSEWVLYFSEQFIDGQDLKETLKKERTLPPSEVVTLGLHITDAIASLWELGKVHRDIKPANIMRRRQTGEFVLLDAGLAFDVAGESLSVTPVGTPAFFSPEQFDFAQRRTLMDFRSDIFSLGVTMYLAAVGKHPFWEPGETSASLYGKILNEPATPPGDIISGFPSDLEEVIMRMLGKSPHLRYRRCSQLTKALEKVSA